MLPHTIDCRAFLRVSCCANCLATEKGERGATYVVLLIAIAILATLASRVAQSWSMAERRQREEQLLFVGGEIRKAVESYYSLTPGPHKRLPESIEQLVSDDRFPKPVRHLRQRYADPMTGRDDWLIVQSPTGGILGVRSSSEQQPLKRAGFLASDAVFENAQNYGDWYFVHVPPALAGSVVPQRRVGPPR